MLKLCLQVCRGGDTGKKEQVEGIEGFGMGGLGTFIFLHNSKIVYNSKIVLEEDFGGLI